MQGFTAGYDGGFKLQSEDGAFVLEPTAQFQFRYNFNVNEQEEFELVDDDGDPDDNDLEDIGDDFERFDDGFELRRVKFGFQGNAFTDKLEYKFQWATSRSGGDVALEDAYIIYEFADNFAFRAGQWKDNVFFEENTSSSRQMAVDRSLINELIGGGRDRPRSGCVADLRPGQRPRRVRAPRRGQHRQHLLPPLRRPSFPVAQDEDGTIEFDAEPNWGGSARLEFVFLGDDFGGAKDFSTIAGNVDGPFGMVGAGANFTEFGDSFLIAHTADVLYKSGEGAGNYSLFGAYYGQYFDLNDTGFVNVDPEDGELSEDGYNAGLEAQVAYATTDNIELFARGSVIFFDFEDFDDNNTIDDSRTGPTRSRSAATTTSRTTPPRSRSTRPGCPTAPRPPTAASASPATATRADLPRSVPAPAVVPPRSDNPIRPAGAGPASGPGGFSLRGRPDRPT